MIRFLLILLAVCALPTATAFIVSFDHSQEVAEMSIACHDFKEATELVAGLSLRGIE